VTRDALRELLDDIAINIALLGVLVACMFLAVPGYFVDTQGGDYPYYVQMAESLRHNSVPSPWRYRPLNPLLASVLMKTGVSANAAFFALTLVFAAVSIVLLRIFLRQLSISNFGARAGALLFAVSVGGYIPLRRYHGYPDALTNCLILLVLIALAANRSTAVAWALGVGTLAKETMLLMVPFVGWRLWRSSGRWPRAALVVVIPIAIYFGLRAVIPAAVGGAAVALSVQAQLDYWQTAMVHGWVRWLLWAVAYSMGPVWLLAAAGSRGNWRFVGTFTLYLIALLVPLLRTTDTERALMLSFPLVFALAAHAIDQRRGGASGIAVAVVAVASQLAAQFTYEWAPTSRIWIVSPKDVVFLALCLTPIAVWLATRAAVTSRLHWPDESQRSLGQD
jgi:hypothetical protein